MRVSVIVPTWNEEQAIEETLRAIAALEPFEILIADGGSTDRTRDLVTNLHLPSLRWIPCQRRGRGPQMAEAATIATGDILWFLHADTLPPPDALRTLCKAAQATPTLAGGNFALHFSGNSLPARFLARVYPLYRYLGLAYGDSGIFATRHAYSKAGGFNPAYPIFEDLDLLRRLKRQGPFLHLDATPLVTSSRRFEHRAFLPVYLRWLWLQLLYWAGVPPRFLSRAYPDVRG